MNLFMNSMFIFLFFLFFLLIMISIYGIRKYRKQQEIELSKYAIEVELKEVKYFRELLIKNIFYIIIMCALVFFIVFVISYIITKAVSLFIVFFALIVILGCIFRVFEILKNYFNINKSGLYKLNHDVFEVQRRYIDYGSYNNYDFSSKKSGKTYYMHHPEELYDFDIDVNKYYFIRNHLIVVRAIKIKEVLHLK